MITVFTPSFADDNNTNAQNLTVKEVVARLDPARFRVVMLGSSAPDSRIKGRPNTQILPWQKRGNTLRLALRLIKQTPDVYFFPREGSLDAAFLAARNTLRLKTALVTYVVSGNLENDHRPLLFRQIRESDVVVANSRHMTKITERLGGKNVQVVYDGIDGRFYYPSSKAEGSEDNRRVLFAGSFRSYKRADLVVREAAKHPQWEFRMAGSGEEESACRKLVEDYRCSNVHFLGHLNAVQLGAEMREAKIFFHPSEIEGHPQVLGQAAACGLPCIARSTYKPDFVADGVTGLLADSDEQLSAALARLIGDAGLRRRMSVSAIQHVEKFKWDDVTKQWQEIFELSIARRSNQRKHAS